MPTESLSQFESAVLEKVLAGDSDVLAMLREQAVQASVSRRELSGVGFFTYFEIPGGVPRTSISELRIADVGAEVEGLQNGAGFVVLVQDGLLSMLEGFSYDEPWPETVRRYSIHYDESPRKLNLPE